MEVLTSESDSSVEEVVSNDDDWGDQDVDIFVNQKTGKYPPNVGSSPRRVKDKRRIAKLWMKKLDKECKNTADENFYVMKKRYR